MRAVTLKRAVPLVQQLVQVKDSELQSLLSGFAAFFCTLGAYFLLLPLRDEAGVSIGTDTLPTLFSVSLVLTFIATPLASAFLSRNSIGRSQAIKQLFSIFACSIAAFFVLYHTTPTHLTQIDTNHHRYPLTQTSEPRSQFLTRQVVASPSTTQSHISDANTSHKPGRHILDASVGAKLANTSSFNARLGNRDLPGSARAVRTAFYLWLTLVNLLATSTLWARAADTFDSNAAKRLFGFLGAGATLGQLSGSIVAAAWASWSALRTPKAAQPTPTSPPVAMLLVSALLLEAAGRLAARMQPAGKNKNDVPDSTLQAPSAGSITHPKSELDARGPSQAQLGQQRHQTQDADAERQTGWGLPSQHASHRSKQDKPLKSKGLQSVKKGLTQLLEGFTLIARSGFLCHVCLHFVLHYIVSTFFYFERTLVVATAGGSASQMVATFALMNSLSAGAVAVLQLTATGHLLSKLGIAWSLTAVPAISALLMSAMAVQPSVAIVGLADILRKVVNYSLARPAREILYTDLSADEKYKAKVCIDTIILRVGDSVGAAVFKTLDKLFGFGPTGVAAAAVPLCLFWSIVAHRLGQKQQLLSLSKDAQ